MGGSLVVAASYNYMLTPMLDDLGLTEDQASVALTIPGIGALLIVFVAGRLGDRLGHRRVSVAMSAAFIVGAILVMVTQGLPLLTVGLLIASIAATAIQIIVIGLLSLTFPEGSARAAAFGTFGMVSPAIWLAVPVITGAVVVDHSWRWVPALWAVAGLLMLLGARVFLPPATSTGPLGEIRTPLAAGITVALAVQALSRLSNSGISSPLTWIVFATTAASGLWCLWLLRRGSTSFSLQPLKRLRPRSLLIVIVIIPMINTVFLMTMAFQYLYGLTVLETALVMVPAQAAAVAGTRLIAAPLMRRYGIDRTAAVFFAVLAVSMLGAFFVTPTSPLWVPILYVTIYNLLTVSASITVTSGVMMTQQDGEDGLIAAYRGSAVSVGCVLAVVVMNSLVFGLARLGMNAEFQESGLSESESEELMQQIQGSSTSTAVVQEYAVPLPDGTDVSTVMVDSIANGLHVNGIAGSLLSILSIVLILRSSRPRRKATAAA